MATYKYQQNLPGGSSAGYVQYNITPDFGAVLAPGESFEITGKIYAGSKKCYGISVEAVHIGASAWYRELAKYAKTISAGKSATFAIGFTVPELGEIETAERQILPTYINFGFLINSELDVGETTDRYDEQRLALVKERLTPAVSGAAFSDSTGAYEYFGGAVQGKSDLSAALTVQLDPLDPSLYITHAELAFAENGIYGDRIYVQEENISGNSLHIGAPAISGEFDGYMLTVTDSKGMRGSYTGNAFTIYPYAAPRLESNGGRELVERYELVKNADNTETPRLAADGEYLWTNFIANITPINGRNAWEVLRRHAVYGEELPDFTVAMDFEDGRVESFTEDMTIFPQTIQFAASKRYAVEIKVTDFFESSVLRFVVEKSGGYFNIEKHGVAAGMRSTATEQEPKLESAYPVYPYQGIKRCDNGAYEMQLELDSKFRLYDEDPGLRLMVYGNVVHLSGIITPVSAISGSTTEHVITEIPAEFAPKYPVTVLQQGTGTAIWMLRVYPATDPADPLKAVFSRYRNGSSYASCAAGNWLPLDAVWIV